MKSNSKSNESDLIFSEINELKAIKKQLKSFNKTLEKLSNLKKKPLNQKEQTNSFPHAIILEKIPKDTQPNDVILHGTVYLRFSTGYGDMCLDSCKHFPNNSQKCKKCILSALNDEYAYHRLLGYDLEISTKKNDPQ